MSNKTDFRSLYDREYIGHFDLPEGRDVIVTISKVIGGELTNVGGRKNKKPIIYFENKERGMVCNKTNGKSIMNMYGPIVEEWKGKRIALYVAMTRSPDGSGDVPCIRIRPQIPAAKGAGKDDAKLSEGPPPEQPETLGDDPDKDNH